MTPEEVLKIRTKKLGLSQRQLAKLMGVSLGAVARWEMGDLPIAGNYERVLLSLDKVPERRAKSKRWVGYLAAGAATAAFLYLLMGTKEGKGRDYGTKPRG